MLDPRIYRMGLVPVVLAVFVLAFSLGNQPTPLEHHAGARRLQRRERVRRRCTRWPTSSRIGAPGSPGGSPARELCGPVSWPQNKFMVSTAVSRARPANGPRTLENVVGVRAGQENGAIVVVAQRDAAGSPSPAQLSGTAVLLELARVLSGETLQHTRGARFDHGLSGRQRGRLRSRRSLLSRSTP